MSFPLDDWQFWVVTLVAVASVLPIVRVLVPKASRDDACPGCTTCESEAPPPGQLVTIGRRRD